MNAKETQLEQSIAQLRTKLLIMCAAVGIALDDACEALVRRNTGKACAVVDGDSVINALENEIDEMAMSILARHQPVAKDLRFVVATLRMVADLERIGDEAVSIAERALALNEALPEPVLGAVASFAVSAKEQLSRSSVAFRLMNSDMAISLCRSEDENTQLEVMALQRIMNYFCGNGDTGSVNPSYAGMHGILICRALNRICRRSANIAEHTYFIVEGLNIKHVPVASNR